MTLLNFPDVNVLLALLAVDHVHRKPAQEWWVRETGRIAVTRFTQVGTLRLLTTQAAMKTHTQTMAGAWSAIDRLFGDDRVVFLPEPAGIEQRFRDRTSADVASPKVWADAWLLAFAEATEGRVVTFDRALAAGHAESLLL